MPRTIHCGEALGVKENPVGLVDRLSAFPCGPSETAGPSLTLPRISCPG